MKKTSSIVVLVTGASSGIGEAAVLKLLAKGYRVHAAARRVERMESLREAGAQIHFLDLTEETSVNALIKNVLQTEGRLDALVNNAATAAYGSVEDVSLADARRQFEVNLFGLARLTQLVVPVMRAQSSGTIVNISSIGGRIHTPLGAWYHASKHALEGWSDSLRIETAPFGIRVVVIQPGAIDTEFGPNAIGPLLERSVNGPYQALAHRMAEATRRTFNSGKASPPSLIANLIVHAIDSPRPRTRYVAGHLARLILTARKVFSDRIFDSLIRKFL